MKYIVVRESGPFTTKGVCKQICNHVGQGIPPAEHFRRLKWLKIIDKADEYIAFEDAEYNGFKGVYDNFPLAIIDEKLEVILKDIAEPLSELKKKRKEVGPTPE